MRDLINKIISNGDDDEKETEEKPVTSDKNLEDLDSSSDYWPYSIDNEPIDRKILSGQEIGYITQEWNRREGKNEQQVWAGKDVRDMFECHRVRDDENTWLGYTRDRIKGFNSVGIQKDSLWRHLAFFGKTGYGKSTILTNLMTQWAMANHGICFIDPKGEDSINLLQKIPEHRLDDVVWVEPGNPKRDRVVGFNFLETMNDPEDYGFENEVGSVVNDLTGVIRAGKTGWGATMDTVSKAVARPLVRAEEDYTILDMWKILTDDEERELFADMFGNSIESQYMNRIKEMDEDEFDPIIRRFEQWVSNSVTRELVAHRKSRVNIAQAVRDGKIIIVRTSELPGEDLKSLVSTAMIKRIWSTITSRDEKKPYFLVVDEFDKVSSGEMNIGEMLSMARSFKLSICLANQYPRQLSDEVKTAIYSNVDNLFSFNIGSANTRDARDISEPFDVSKQDVFNLDMFQIIGRLSIDGEKTDTLKINTFPPYPYRRDENEVKNLITRKLREQGVKKLDGTEEYGVLAPKGISKEGSERSFVDETTGEEITEEQVLACVHTGGIRNGTRKIDGSEGWVSKEYIVEEMKNYVGESYESILSNAVEKIPEAKLKTCTADGGNVFMRLTSEGETEVFVQDTGSGGSSGKIGHKTILKKSYKAFTKLGYKVKLPKQIGEEQADGIAEPPIKPAEESETVEEVKELERRIEDEYPRLYELFGDATLNLEAESTTVKGKPKQTIKNLAKADKDGRKAIFLVEEGEDKFERWGVKCEEIFCRPPFVREIDEYGNRWFYTESTKMTLDDGFHPLQKGNRKSTVWKERNGDSGNEIVLEDPDDGSVITSFKDISELSKPSKISFPYSYDYDRSREKVIIRNDKGNEVETFENTEEMSKKGNYTPIREPLIPEKLFSGGTYPDRDMWEVVILPDKESDYDEPQIYREGELIPLFSGKETSTKNKTDSKNTQKEGDEDFKPNKETQKEAPEPEDTDDTSEKPEENREKDDLSQAAMEGYMQNDGEPPEFVDNRDLKDKKEVENEDEEEKEEKESELEFPEKPF